jgi:hypothetical protein
MAQTPVEKLQAELLEWRAEVATVTKSSIPTSGRVKWIRAVASTAWFSNTTTTRSGRRRRDGRRKGNGPPAGSRPGRTHIMLQSRSPSFVTVASYPLTLGELGSTPLTPSLSTQSSYKKKRRKASAPGSRTQKDDASVSTLLSVRKRRATSRRSESSGARSTRPRVTSPRLAHYTREHSRTR